MDYAAVAIMKRHLHDLAAGIPDELKIAVVRA
jgi:hypothetical protein